MNRFQHDVNFDPLALKLQRNIYKTNKGKIRTAVVWRDLEIVLASFMKRVKAKNIDPPLPLRILDAGGGFGYFTLKLAALGHRVTLCDLSKVMLDLAQEKIEQYQSLNPTVSLDIQLVHCSIQEFVSENLSALSEKNSYDLILCHAVAEWLNDSKKTLSSLLTLLKIGGFFSLLFYNRDAQLFHNLLAGNFDYVETGLQAKKRVRLTPLYPLRLPEVSEWFLEWGLNRFHCSGVRVLNDYLKYNQNIIHSDRIEQEKTEAEHRYIEQLLSMELRYSTESPFLELGRYIHLIGQKE